MIVRVLKKISLSLLVVLGTTSCSSFNYEKGGTILGTGLGTGGGYYMCQNVGFDQRFTIGCMVIGGLMGGLMGGNIGETFDNKEIYETVNTSNVGETRSFTNGDDSMNVTITDSYQGMMEDWKGDDFSSWCKDFQFELHENGNFKRGKGTSCKDNEGKWKTMGIDLIR